MPQINYDNNNETEINSNFSTNMENDFISAEELNRLYNSTKNK